MTHTPTSVDIIRSGPSRKFLINATMIFLLAVVSQTVQAQQSTECEQALTTAENYISDLSFEEAIDLLNGCLELGAFLEEEQQQVYLLLARAHFKNDEPEQTKKMLRLLLDLDPDYIPDPKEDPDFIALLEEIRHERKALEAERQLADRQSTGGSMTTKVLIGGGVLVVGGVVLALLVGGGGDSGPSSETLMGPPLLPSGN